jgi:hypothetical protein
MDGEVEQVLRRAKAIKGKLEALDRQNAASRKIPGCGAGSSTDRTRSSVVSGLGRKLKDLMDDFQVNIAFAFLIGSLPSPRAESGNLIGESACVRACRVFGRGWRRSTRRRWRGGTTR